MKFERTWTGNWENAFHGLRHPMESYAKSDTGWYEDTVENENLCFNQALMVDSDNCTFLGIGPKDMDLAQRMIKAGTPNDKFLRQIFISVDITAPLYWWKEMDTYKVATTANSTSTMHKLATTPITLDCFEIDDLNEWLELNGQPLNYGFENIIKYCEELRQKYLETKDIRYWKELIRWLPESWLQTRTWTADYSVLRNIIRWRSNHKLTEWHQFVDWCRGLPYADELLFYNQSLEK
jgi:hypothetical protein